jgi:hypothetical protein
MAESISGGMTPKIVHPKNKSNTNTNNNTNVNADNT